jgi:hypothetical protein
LLEGFIPKSLSDSFLPTFSKLPELGFWLRVGAWGGAAGTVGVVLEYWSVKFLAGGQARVLRGIVLGIGSLIKGSERISSRVGLLDASSTKILEMRFLAF